MPPLAVLVALADPTRCRIIEILRDGAQPVHVLASHFDISRPAISRHLRVLKQASLISERKLGRENRYALHASKLKPIREWLDDILPDAAPKPAPPLVAYEPVVAKAPRQRSVRKKPAVVEPAPPVPAPRAEQPASVAAIPEAPMPARPATQMGFDF